MAKQEHLDILRQGVDIWNTWREDHPEIIPDLSKADLSKFDLSGANLDRANLNGANLNGANLEFATLSETSFIRANLSYAYLDYTNLLEANFYGADLSHADLSRAGLDEADLSETNLSETNLSEASIEGTIFGNVDLRSVKGLDTIQHNGPSSIDTRTLLRSEGAIPEIFLRGVGLPDTFIEYVRSLVNSPIKYYTCFISYSSKDSDFAERLYADLQRNGIRCWFAPEDLKIGDKIRSRIDESIRLHDKLLVILSQHSIISSWVEKEVETTFAREAKENKLVLFPIRLDDAVKQCDQAWAADIRRMRHIGNFSRWKEQEEYQKAFARLLRDLQTSVTITPQP